MRRDAEDVTVERRVDSRGHYDCNFRNLASAFGCNAPRAASTLRTASSIFSSGIDPSSVGKYTGGPFFGFSRGTGLRRLRGFFVVAMVKSYAYCETTTRFLPLPAPSLRYE
jgi:hypothetical protein